MVGNTLIIIMLMPILFTVIVLAHQQKERHREIQERLDRIEKSVKQ